MIIVLHTMHRAAQAGSMLQVDHMHGPVAAVQQSTMPGACQELASITLPHTARVGTRALCSPASVAPRRKLLLSGLGESHMHTNSTLSEQDKLVLHWGAALTVGAQDSYIFSLGPRSYDHSH